VSWPPGSEDREPLVGDWREHPLVLRREAELGELVNMVALRSDLILRAGEPGSGWWYQPRSGRVNADAGDLLDRHGDFVRGLTLHEASHAAITRYQAMVPRQALQQSWLRLLLNVVEDCRIEEWMQRRLPGCTPWVKAYNDRLFGRMRARPRPDALLARYSIGLLCRWWFGEWPADLGQPVSAALEASWPAVQRAIAAQPPATRVELPSLAWHYWSSPVCRAFVARDAQHAPDSWEILVRLAQYRCWAILHSEVLPAIAHLEREDRQQAHAEQANRELLAQLRAQRAPPADAEQGEPRPGQGHGWGVAAGQGAGAGTRAAIERALQVDPDDKYLQAWKRVAPLVDELTDQLARELDKLSRSHWVPGFPSGARLDARVAMQMEADPSWYVALWQRKSLPRRIDPAFVLVLDRSGSMHGDTMERAFEGLVLLVEVCRRLSIPADVWSFANDHKLEHSWDQGLGPEVRRQLGRLPQRCDGGTSMDGALEALRHRLPLLPHRDRVLLVLGDGQPNDVTATRRVLRDLHGDGVACIGLGIGSGTRDMQGLFQDGLFAVPVERVARSLAQIIRAALGVSSTPPGARAARR